MTGTTTKQLLPVYNQTASPTMFMSERFQSPAQNFHSSEEVEIDVVRNDEDVSIVIQDLSTGYRFNSEDVFTNKAFKPPIHKEAIALDAFSLIKRSPGVNPFNQPDFRANLIIKMFNGMSKIERKIRRAMEQQASQVLQTGIVTLKDSNGVALYTLDFKPKSSHFPTAGTSWATATGEQMLNDISSIAELNRDDGLADSDELIFGVTAFEKFISNADVQKRFDIRNFQLGRISPMERANNGGSFRGIVEIGNYRYDVWTYGGRFNDPENPGTKIQYMDPGKVIVRSSSARLDATFGAIPNIGVELGIQPQNVLPELAGRFTNAAGGMDLFTNAWLSDDGEQLFAGVGARPLMIPTAIDTYGCLITQL